MQLDVKKGREDERDGSAACGPDESQDDLKLCDAERDQEADQQDARGD